MSGTNERGVLFGTPDRGHEASTRAARGRVCDHMDCSTVLSIYNSSGTCWFHAKPSYAHALARPNVYRQPAKD